MKKIFALITLALTSLIFPTSLWAVQATMTFQSEQFQVTVPAKWSVKVTKTSKISDWGELEPGQKDVQTNDRYGFFDENGKEQAAFFWNMEAFLSCEEIDSHPLVKVVKGSFAKNRDGCSIIHTSEKGQKAPLFSYRYGVSMEDSSYYVCRDADTYGEKNLKHVQEICRSIRRLPQTKAK